MDNLKADIRNAGGTWADKEAVVDGNVVWSRKPDDIPAFNRILDNARAFLRQHPVESGCRVKESETRT